MRVKAKFSMLKYQTVGEEKKLNLRIIGTGIPFKNVFYFIHNIQPVLCAFYLLHIFKTVSSAAYEIPLCCSMLDSTQDCSYRMVLLPVINDRCLLY